MGAAGGTGSLGRRSTASFEETGERYACSVRLLLASHPCQWITKVPHGKFCIYIWKEKKERERNLPFSLYSNAHSWRASSIASTPLSHTPCCTYYGQSSCNGFCVLLDILHNCILVHPKEKRKQICLICLFRNTPWGSPAYLAQHSDIAACHITFSLPRTDPTPDCKYSGASALTSLTGKFTRIEVLST